MTNVISYSIFGAGHEKAYQGGALINIFEARRLYPDFTCRFYLGRHVTASFEAVLREQGAQTVRVDTPLSKEEWDGLFWRFLAASDGNVDVILCRDCDGMITDREVSAVREWLASPFDFHVMRDHPMHGMPILGGTWGARRGILRNMKNLVEQWSQKTAKNDDQLFLNAVLPEIIKGKVMVHDNLDRGYDMPWKPYPTERKFCEFVGQNIYSKYVSKELLEMLNKQPLT